MPYSLDLEFENIGGKSSMIRRRFRWPFHIGSQLVSQYNPQVARVIVQNSASTLNAGDYTRTRFELHQNSEVKIMAQGAPSVHRSRNKKEVREETEIRLHTAAYLRYFPEPRILFPNSYYSQTMKIDIESSSRLLLTDGMIA